MLRKLSEQIDEYEYFAVSTLYLAIVEYRTWQAGQPGIIHSQVLDYILHIRVVDLEWFVSDPTPDPDPTFKEVSAPTPDPDPISDPATLNSASRELHSKLALYLWNYDDIYSFLENKLL